jgi:hypothetical protein
METMSPLPEYQENINHVNVLLDHVDPHTSTLNKSISKVHRLQFLHASISKRVRNMLNNFPTNVYHYEEIDKKKFTLEEKINTRFVSVMSPSKIMTKRQHNFLSRKLNIYNIIVIGIEVRINHNFKGLEGFA